MDLAEGLTNIPRANSGSRQTGLGVQTFHWTTAVALFDLHRNIRLPVSVSAIFCVKFQVFKKIVKWSGLLNFERSFWAVFKKDPTQGGML